MAGALALMEPLHLNRDNALGIEGLAATFFKMRRGYLLQIVDVVDKNAVKIVHLDRCRDGDVDEDYEIVQDLQKLCPCSRRKMGCGAPVELMTMSVPAAAS